MTCPCGATTPGASRYCSPCAYQRKRDRIGNGSRQVRREGQECSEPGCTRKTVPGANGPMPTRCPWCWHANERERLRAWRAAKSHGGENAG